MRKSKWLPSSEIFRVNITKKQIFEKENIKNRLGWMMPVWISSSFGRTEADMFGSSLECLAECLLYVSRHQVRNITVSLRTGLPKTSNSRFLGFPRKPKLHFHAAGLFLSPFIFDIKKIDQFQSHNSIHGSDGSLFLRNTTLSRFFFAETEKYILPNGGLIVWWWFMMIKQLPNKHIQPSCFCFRALLLHFFLWFPSKKEK